MLVTVSVWKETRIDRLDGKSIHRLSAGKRSWVACYLDRADITECDRSTGFQMHPEPVRTGMPEKLEYLRRNSLGIFSGVASTDD